MHKQERQIIYLLLNEMAFEGTIKHFEIDPPEIDEKIFDSLREIGIPMKYDGSTEQYVYEDIKFDENLGVFYNCYKYLRIIRNNIIHANKAYLPDTPERLFDLLNWANNFIKTVYKTDTEFAKQCKEIKRILKIRKF